MFHNDRTSLLPFHRTVCQICAGSSEYTGSQSSAEKPSYGLNCGSSTSTRIVAAVSLGVEFERVALEYELPCGCLSLFIGRFQLGPAILAQDEDPYGARAHPGISTQRVDKFLPISQSPVDNSPPAPWCCWGVVSRDAHRRQRRFCHRERVDRHRPHYLAVIHRSRQGSQARRSRRRNRQSGALFGDVCRAQSPRAFARL